METKPKTYKEEIVPLWQEEIKQAMDWRNPMNALIKLGIFFGGLWFSYWLTGQLESFIGTLSFQVGGIIFVIIGLLPISLYTYMRASRKLYENQIARRRELGDFIENPFDISAREPYMKNPDQERWASINVINTTSLVISDCSVEMVKATDSDGNLVVPIPQNLQLSHSHGIARNRAIDVHSSPIIIDVAQALPHKNQIHFETWAGMYWGHVGVYYITIVVHGLYNGFLRKAEYSLIVEYNGGNLINIRREGQEKWPKEKLDPKPPATPASPMKNEEPKMIQKKRKSSQKKTSSKP